MPIYEFRCRKCGEISSFLEKVGEIKLWGRKCSRCGSRKLSKALSSFSTSRSESMADTLNELKKMGNVNFVPRYPGMGGPPPGGCPYSKESDSDSSE
jgi:putative FmdB family regulatory protein